MTKEKFDLYVKNKIADKESDLKIIQSLVDALIQALYKPVHTDIQTEVDKERLKEFNVDINEPINWGDLKCISVEKTEDDIYIVILDEAAPDDCQSLCYYIGIFMEAWGWNVNVVTEW